MTDSGGIGFRIEVYVRMYIHMEGCSYVGSPQYVRVCTARKGADAMRRLSGERGGDVSVNLKQAVRSGCRVALRTMGLALRRRLPTCW